MEKRSLKIILSKCWLLLQLLLLYIWSTTIFDSVPAVQCPPLKLAQISILPIHFEKGNPLFLLNRYIKYRILNSNLLKCDFVAGRSDENDVSQVKRWNYKMINVCKVIIHVYLAHVIKTTNFPNSESPIFCLLAWSTVGRDTLQFINWNHATFSNSF